MTRADLQRIARVLVALELADETLPILAVEDTTDCRQLGIVGKSLPTNFKKPRTQTRVGIHDHDDVRGVTIR